MLIRARRNLTLRDATQTDSVAEDAGMHEAGMQQAGLQQAGMHDAGMPDAATAQAAACDAATREPAGVTWTRDLALSVLASMFIILFLYQPVRVEGISMMPGLEDQDRLFINKIAYRFEPIRRDDIVVFQFPRDHTKSYIKRVIGVPGDTVRIDDGRVFVNDRALDEPYVPARFQDDHSMPALQVPAGQYFVLGDHRNVASDSRDFGTVARELIYGKAEFVYWPLAQAGGVR